MRRNLARHRELVVLVLVVSSLAPTLHLVLEPHFFCAAHHVVTHGHGCHGEPDTPPLGNAPGPADGAPARDACPVLALLSAPGLCAPADGAAMRPEPFVGALPPAPDCAWAHAALPALARAPNHSPPA